MVRWSKWCETIGVCVASLILTVAVLAKFVYVPTAEAESQGIWLRLIAVLEAIVVLGMWTRWRSLSLAAVTALAAYGVVVALAVKAECGCLGAVSLSAAAHMLLAATLGACSSVAIWARCVRAPAMEEV